MSFWTADEVDTLKKLYGNIQIKELSELLGKSIMSLRKKAKRLNLSLTEDQRHEIFVAQGSRLHEHSQFGEDNPNWKGGISKNKYHYKKIQKRRYPERVKARELVSRALKKNILMRMPCEVCGDQNSHAHHEDYSKPLEFVWLCRKHHTERHRDCS